MNKVTGEVDNNGFYGRFGGAYIPEMMYPNLKELENRYREITDSREFREEFTGLLRDYVGRPSPLYRAGRLSDYYNTNIFLKREDLNHTGAHKINNTVGQIILARHLGKKRIIAETGAGQHGVATATVCALTGTECVVYMGALDVARQQPNVERMKMLGATVVPVHSGNKTLKDATNEALRDWISNPCDTHYIIGSIVGPHPYPDIVTRFQSVISEEIKAQLEQHNGNPLPDAVIACVGGGSNAAGAFFHYLQHPEVELIAVEAAGHGVDSGESAATIALGRPGVLHGCLSVVMQDADGQITEPYSVSAGLDYPGIGPLFAHLHQKGRVNFQHATDREAMDAAFLLTQLEGIIPALESAHALAFLEKRKFTPDQTVVINLSGRGDKDMEAYLKYIKEHNGGKSHQ
ncbi:MAG: tryptophan synthase subunit beta [Bacteroidales bacterium]|nr:tryptophan synthase subunit beta [Bacteroidales bacterium]